MFPVIVLQITPCAKVFIADIGVL